MKIISIILFILLLPLIAHANNAFEVRGKFPPYPEVWGYDLSEYQAAQIPGIKTSIDAYKSKNGDVCFGFYSKLQRKDPNDPFSSIIGEEYKLIKFFSGEIVDLDEKSSLEFFSLSMGDNDVNNNVNYNRKVTFSDGSTIGVHSHSVLVAYVDITIY